MERKFIYILLAVSARYLSEEEVQKKFDLYKIKYNRPQNYSFERYKASEEFYSNIPINISISAEPVAYFDNEEDARYAAVNNLGDYNDGGVYNYSVIQKVLNGYLYPEASSQASYEVFKFVSLEDGYIPVPSDDELGCFIYKKLNRID